MKMKENGFLTSEAVQKIKMCIKTFINLYGFMPSAQEMIDWLGTAYAQAVPEYMSCAAAF